MAMDAGMLMTEEVTRFWGGTPKLIYAANTVPEIVEKPRASKKLIDNNVKKHEGTNLMSW